MHGSTAAHRAQASLELLVLLAGLTAAMLVWMGPAQKASGVAVLAIQEREVEEIAQRVCGLAREAAVLGKGSKLVQTFTLRQELKISHSSGKITVDAGSFKKSLECGEKIIMVGGTQLALKPGAYWFTAGQTEAGIGIMAAKQALG